MTSSSPPTRRVVDIIELLAERRGSTTRLSDIVHALGLNQATAYVILKLADDQPKVLDEQVEFSERADGTSGSSSKIRAGERIPVRELRVQRKLRLIYRKEAGLSHAARAFLKVAEAVALERAGRYRFQRES